MTKLNRLSLIAAATVLLSGCGAAKTNQANVATYKPTLEVSADVKDDTATLHISTDLILSKEHYDHARKQGEGHIHLSLDQGEKVNVMDRQEVLEHLSKGAHTVKLSLHNNDHTPYDVSKTINFDVK
ncbi:hypothetical protein GK047_11275 [Paenibacillus sp. SYP-B3998]|uniref:YtkA-like domain-containing protein n=1 Tax=Paenibacillus sp. SYP-B3998 TaxID=2678564 RepID=A0A6G3ZY28_9BACL|nr:hypothetical protein [Paenibacillus sp. SYP-B3998]NEW06594.1 hypothetical protein [Paenibacillus sp. SYP-B3998]